MPGRGLETSVDSKFRANIEEPNWGIARTFLTDVGSYGKYAHIYHRSHPYAGIWPSHHKQVRSPLCVLVAFDTYFVPLGSMYTDMMDIASQLVLKWERFGPEHVFDATEDFTRLAFDTISLCAMGHRLNSFYTDQVPEFVKAMGDFLVECYHRPRRLKFISAFMTSQNAKWEADAEKMSELCSSSQSILTPSRCRILTRYSHCRKESGWWKRSQRSP
jgi:hypothetical protein